MEPDRAKEREELTFLVGNACSRVINLLMRPGVDERELREELRFLSEKSARLAGLLTGEDADDGPSGEARGGAPH